MFSAYKKKQEFEGGITFDKMDCNFSQNRLSADKYSIIRELNNNKKNEL